MKPIRTDGIDPAARSRARRRALQALYAWQLAGNSIPQVIHQFQHEQDMEVADLDYFEALVKGVAEHRASLDERLAAHLDRAIELVDPVERAVLRIAAFELLHRLDVPYRVVLNEAIETAKRFGSDHGHTYVNGVLDRAAAEWRPAEAGQGRR
ncbi:MAG: transcription antitermination factor NusB [Xanthomonadaceae bacterium]|jgi:N utilization substance protein B|nr:transcription antitermination factor NusB [Xanthomonadaceae bacterium]